MKKTQFISGFLIFISITAAFITLSMSRGIRSECKNVTGIVTAIYQDGTRDVVFKISGQKPVFYINRGFEKKFTLNALIDKLEGKEVTILYADNWTPLGSISECHPINELSSNNELVYSEY
jgi:hypothetical protein